MKELKHTMTVEKVYAYEAFDGATFGSREECEKYEQSATCTIRKMALDMRVKDLCVESLLPCYDCEDGLAVWDIKDAEHLRIVNQYLDTFRLYPSKNEATIPAEYIGRRVAVVYHESDCYATLLGSYDEILSDFVSKLNKLFADPAPTT